MRNNKIKIIVDTNVFINGMIFPEEYINDGKVFDIVLNLIDKNKIELVFSQETIGELIYLMKNFIKYNIKDINNQFEFLHGIIDLIYENYSINTEHTVCEKCDDPKDDMFIECAFQSRADYIITNDYKSGMFKITKYKFKVVNCEDFIKMFDNKIDEQEQDNQQDEIAQE